MSEKDYDEIIAPALLEIAKKAESLGMSFVASVEWEPGESGSTVTGDFSNAGVTQYMTLLAARSNRNIDAVCLGLIKRFPDTSASIFLSRFGAQP